MYVDTDHYSEYDSEITEAEAIEILYSYIPVALDTKPLTEFEGHNFFDELFKYYFLQDNPVRFFLIVMQ